MPVLLCVMHLHGSYLAWSNMNCCKSTCICRLTELDNYSLCLVLSVYPNQHLYHKTARLVKAQGKMSYLVAVVPVLLEAAG